MAIRLRNNAYLKQGIIRELYFQSDQSCGELSERLGKSIPSVTNILHELVKEEKVINRGEATSSGGRRPLVYALPSGKEYIVAVALDQLESRVAILNMQNNYVAGPYCLQLGLLNNDEAVETLENFINDSIKKSKVDKKQIIGVGIGMPGFVNKREGVNYTYLFSNEKSLQQHLSDAISLPVWMDNDSSLVALAELRFGVAKERESAMVVNIGWGIGLGIVLNGEIFRGYNGYAGEFSQIPMKEEGELCVCGKRGCLETEASLLVVSKKAIRDIKKGKISSLQKIETELPIVMGKAIMKAALNGDQFAIELVSDMGYKIGKAISILIHIMDPQTIVLSGRGATVGKILVTSIQDSLNKYCIPRLSAHTEFCISQLGENAELIGAAALVMENYRMVKERNKKSLITF